MRLALIQNHCSPDRNENLERALNSMEQAKESGADMVVFPELAVDRFFPQYEEWNAREIAEPIPGPTTRVIGSKAKSLSLVTVFNLYEEAVAGRYFETGATNEWPAAPGPGGSASDCEGFSGPARPFQQAFRRVFLPPSGPPLPGLVPACMLA